MTKQVIVYLPVVHAGYMEFLKRHQSAEEILVLDRSFTELFPQLKKDIRALDPDLAVRMIRPYLPGSHVHVIGYPEGKNLLFADEIVMPDEDIMQELATKWELDPVKVRFENVCLRWDRSRAEAEREVAADEEISSDELYLMLADMADAEAEKSPDCWRQVGAVAWKDGKILFADHNRHLPTDYTTVIEGDPRGNFRGGVRTDLSLALHAEPGIIGRAAKEGVSLSGATIAVNTFPCPSCARLIIAAGFAEVVFRTGYVLLEGDDLLRRSGVKITRVLPK